VPAPPEKRFLISIAKADTMPWFFVVETVAEVTIRGKMEERL